VSLSVCYCYGGVKQMIFTIVNEGLLLSFLVGSRIGGANNFSHFLFADDTLIFCSIYPDHLCNLCCLFLCLKQFQI
jgi:hypothetical protein